MHRLIRSQCNCRAVVVVVSQIGWFGCPSRYVFQVGQRGCRASIMMPQPRSLPAFDSVPSLRMALRDFSASNRNCTCVDHTGRVVQDLQLDNCGNRGMPITC